MSTLHYTGVNEAGAEFDSGTTYPTQSSLDYFFAKKMNTIRLPFKWERLQPTLMGDFSTTELSNLSNTVNYITSKGKYVVLDPHNYARYNGQVIGASSVTVEHFQDLWSRLATLYKSNNKVIFGLMNEPNNMSTETWLADANAAISAIRQTGATNLILVPGNAWTGAHSWLQNWYGTPNGDVMDGIVDSGNNFAIEVHQYLDSDFSGTNAACVSGTIGSEKMADFTNWCRVKGYKAFLGEFGVGTSQTCLDALDNILTYMDSNADVWIGWTWWAAGVAWPSDYIYLVEPQGSPGSYIDRVQMPYLVEHAAASTPPKNGPTGRGVVSLASDAKGDTFQLSAATLTSSNVALIWTQPREWASSTNERSKLSGYVVKPANAAKVVTQTRGGPYDGTTDEEYIRVARLSENRFAVAWEDQVKNPDTNLRVNSVLVQVFSGTTGEELQPPFKWDLTAKKYNPDIAYVTTSQVVVVYEEQTSTSTQVKMIRLRVTSTGALTVVKSPQVVIASGSSPRVQGTSAGGFFVTYLKSDGKTYVKTYNNLNELIVGPIVVSGADAVTYLPNSGRIVVVWEDLKKIYYRLYDAVTGAPFTQKLSATNGSNIQMNPAVTRLSGGGFMITWQQKATSTSDNNIMASEFRGNGNRVAGSPFGVHAGKTAGEQTRPTVAEVDDGAVLFAWNHQNTASAVTSRVQYQIFDLASTTAAAAQQQLLGK